MGPDVNHLEHSARKGRFGRVHLANPALREAVANNDTSLFTGAIVIKATSRRRGGYTEYLMYHPDFVEIDIGEPVPRYTKVEGVWKFWRSS